MKGENGVDISLYYQEQGEGEALFLLHGNGEDGTYFADHIPNAKLSVIPGDHFIASKNPKDFNGEVENFLLRR